MPHNAVLLGQFITAADLYVFFFCFFSFYRVGVDSDQDNSVSVPPCEILTQYYYDAVHNDCKKTPKVLFLFAQMSIAEGSERRSTKQESAWLFRIWYNFDHKYPSATNDSFLSVLLTSRKPSFFFICLYFCHQGISEECCTSDTETKNKQIKVQNKTERAEIITRPNTLTKYH